MEPLTGRALPRREDRRFLTGESAFTDDLRPPGQVCGVVVRAIHPHARIESLRIEAALGAPGVLDVITPDILAAESVGPIPSLAHTPPFEVRNRDGALPPHASQPVLATGKVRYLGEPVAFVVAETLEQACDAAEQVEVTYTELAPIITVTDALDGQLGWVWDELGSNLSLDWEGGDEASVDDAFEDAHRVTRVSLVNNRVSVVFMEPRAAIAEHDAAADTYSLTAGAQSAHVLRSTLASMLNVAPERIRVRVPDTGGGFGARNGVHPEFPLALIAARRVGRPVKWTADRSESFLSDTQSRDHILHGELAMDAGGRFTAVRARVDWRHGGYLTSRALWIIAHYLPPTVGSVYAIPRGHHRIRGIFSNTTPTAPYRGIGRVESNYLTERLVEQAAREMGADAVELRRRNLVAAAQIPWRTSGGSVYTSGEFEQNLDRALALADREGFPARRDAARRRGRLRGLGVSMFIENDGGAAPDYARIEATAAEEVLVYAGTQDFGMGHATVYAQVVADRLGVPMEAVRVIQGDTLLVKRGFGSFGSRSARIGGGAVVGGIEALIERGTALAAARLEAAAPDIGYANGAFIIHGTDRAVGLFELAADASNRGESLHGEADFQPDCDVHSNGCQVSEVEIDPETGVVRLIEHVVVADVGRVLNPLIVEGQLHGGAAQGIGQAALEAVAYEPGTGQTLSGSLMDYTIPRADDLPEFKVALNEVVEADNPLGVKGVGETGTSGAPAAVINAILDALAGIGVDHLDMPATPERVWRAIRSAPARNATSGP